MMACLATSLNAMFCALSLGAVAIIPAFLIQSSAFYLAAVAGSITYDPAKITIWSLYSVLILSLKISFWLMLGGIVVSWIANDNQHPATRLLMQMSDSIFAPF